MRIREIILQTASPVLSSFYEEILGLPVSRGNGEFSIHLSESIIRFQPAAAGTNPFYHFAINIPCNQVCAAKQWLQSRVGIIYIDDYKSHIADFVNWHAKSLYFFDPAGNIVELIARFDLDNEKQEPFSANSFLSVSEIGLVYEAAAIEQKTNELLGQFGLSYFDKQKPFPQFKAIGNDEGLFIVVTDNRHWYPTSKPSAVFPILVHFENNNQKYQLVL